jgi:hypothetical protein
MSSLFLLLRKRQEALPVPRDIAAAAIGLADRIAAKATNACSIFTLILPTGVRTLELAEAAGE